MKPLTRADPFYMLPGVTHSNTPNRYQPLVEMAREMSLASGAPAQAHFDSLLKLLRGPSHLRRSLWYVERNRLLVTALIVVIASSGAYFAL